MPLLFLAALYLGAAAALLPSLWRERSRAGAADLVLVALLPCLGIPFAIWGAAVLIDREPLAGDVWLPLAGIAIAFVPPLLLLLRGSERARTLLSPLRAREAEALVTMRERELDSVASMSNALSRSNDVESIARVLLTEVLGLDVQFAALALADEELNEFHGVLAIGEGGEEDWWREFVIDSRSEPSGIASAAYEGAPLTVFDAETSPIINPRILGRVHAKSIIFIPLVSNGRVLGVVAGATTRERRAFGGDELALLQALAAEAALAIDRVRSASELARALERERFVARIGLQVRSELDLDSVLRVAVKETAQALSLTRCLIRLGQPGGGELQLAAEWHAEGREPVVDADRLPISNLAARERRTIAVAQVEVAAELADESLGGRETLLELGAGAALATPIIVFERMIGVLALHRAEAGEWDEADIALAEAVAREAGLAIHTARLLRENEERLREQAALLEAAQVVTSELELDAVIQRLVDEVAALLQVPAADCFLYDPSGGVLRCAAVHGLDPSLVGWEFPADRGVAGEAIAQGKAVRLEDYANVSEPVPHPAYEGFATAMAAPMTWAGETRGVLGVGVRDGSRRFGSADANVLQAFAGLASLALRNAESFRERSRQARIQRAFYRIASVLGQSLSLSETLGAVAHAAGEALGGTYAAVMMPRVPGLELAGSEGLPEAVAAALREGATEAAPALAGAVRDRHVVTSAALATDERFEGQWATLAEKAGFRSLLAIPIEPARAEGAGLVIVFFDAERAFTDEDLELARHLAEAARGALERSELFEAERSSRALAQQFARTAALLATELDPASVLEEVVQQAPALLGVEACAIRVLEDGELVVSTASGEGAEQSIQTRSPATGSLAGDVVQSRMPVVIADVAAERRLIDADPMLAAGYGAYLGVPLVGTEGNLHGVLSVYGRRPRAWREDEIEALLALAGNASAALSNAELYQRVAVEKERNDAILANVADGIVAVDRDGKVVLWNPAAEQITGVPQGQALGRTPEEVLRRTLATEGEEPPASRLVSIPRSGEDVWLSLSEAVMRDPAGAVSGRIFAFRDISAERLVEQMKSDFVSTVSQQLRTPLTSIYGFAETLLRSDVLFGEEERKTFLGYIASESERLTRIVDNLLSVARLDTGDLRVQIAPTEIRQVVSEAVTNVQETVTPNGHEFIVDLPAEPLTADADREKLRQIVSILVDNAVKYSPEGGTVTVAARRKNDAIEVRVDDEGVGIPASEQHRIFTKFYRRMAPDSVAGTGLGLFIAQGLLTAMGGKIWVQSSEGEGSSFVFELPFARVGAEGSDS